jgi:hypothetical protein
MPAHQAKPPAETHPWGPQGPVRDMRWVPIAGAVGLLLVLVFVGYSLRGLFTPAGLRTQPSFPTPTPTPAGLEFGRAYLFWNNSAVPAVAAFNKTLPTLNARCKGTYPTTCRAAITASDQKLQQAIAVITNGDIPACIADDLRRYKGDLLSMDGGLQIALNGYGARNKGMILQGLAQFREGSRPLAADAAAITKDIKALCH